jgi:hypothetical protein
MFGFLLSAFGVVTNVFGITLMFLGFYLVEYAALGK